jgi:hypothetical protein
MMPIAYNRDDAKQESTAERASDHLPNNVQERIFWDIARNGVMDMMDGNNRKTKQTPVVGAIWNLPTGFLAAFVLHNDQFT